VRVSATPTVSVNCICNELPPGDQLFSPLARLPNLSDLSPVGQSAWS
jgi:hypothetical protein